ncbi:SubName: Full=Related to DNA repair endonuclease rad2 {ECO:0000313/EMBL:CCA73914.1} [Serendipita indica DSM 11827]|nr:SubName: Full=Related to DNA repair endonuclease rad2 {ECO:0000313/EMBL:CCA73914.1} [Serendipita indica DSM 11827]
MGVPGLWEILRPAAQQRSIVHLAIYDGFLSDEHNKRGYRIGIDASIWFFHSHSSREGENPELRMLFFRLAKFLALPLLPLFVFDGPRRPHYKRGKRVMGAQHGLTSSFKRMIEAYGFEHHQASRTLTYKQPLTRYLKAPGEAEAELAYLNRIGIIDAVLSDDVDNFLFGATLVMRNPSATLSGNKNLAMRNADGKQDKEHVILFSAELIKDHADIQLSHGGFILMGLLSGGDYSTGLHKCGIKTSHGLARAGFGDYLIELYESTPPHQLQNALSEWREQLRRYLSTDPDGHIGRKQKSLAKSIPDTFPPLDILESYLRPVTSETIGHVPNFEWAKQPSLKEIANSCEMHYEWGVKPLIIKRFRTVIWPGAVVRVLRASVMKGDQKEQRQAAARGVLYTPSHGRRDAQTAFGTPSKLVSESLSRLELSRPARGNPFDDDYVREPTYEPLIVKIHSQRQHASTDHVLEYRVEIAPEQFVRMTEAGLLNLRREDSIDVANFGRRRMLLDNEDEFGGFGEEGEGENKSKTADPLEHMRIWIPACMLEMVEPELVEEYENSVDSKERKKVAREQRAKDKAEGRVAPKSRSKASPRKKAQTRAIEGDESDDLLPESPTKPKAKSKIGARRENHDPDTDMESLGTSNKGKKSGPVVRDLPISLAALFETHIDSPSINLPNAPSRNIPATTSKGKGRDKDKVAPRFLFSMKPDYVDLDAEEEKEGEELDPYEALRRNREITSSGSSGMPSRSTSGQSSTQTPSSGPSSHTLLSSGTTSLINKPPTMTSSTSTSRRLPPAFASCTGKNARKKGPHGPGPEPMEDFTDLFATASSEDERLTYGRGRSAQGPEDVSSGGPGGGRGQRTNRFVHSDSEEDDHLPISRSKGKKPTSNLGAPIRSSSKTANLVGSSKSKEGIHPANDPSNAANSRAPAGVSIIELLDSDSDTPISTQPVLKQAAKHVAPKPFLSTSRRPAHADVSIIDLDSD